MIRLILYTIIGFVLFRLVRSLMNFLTQSATPRPPREKTSARPPKQEFSDVQDAEFEDITPKKPPEGKPSSG